MKTLRIEYANNREGIVVNGGGVQDVEEFPYLGATVDKEGGGSKDITNRLQKARSAFQRLGKGSQRNRKENQDTPIQDLSLTSPAIWL